MKRQLSRTKRWANATVKVADAVSKLRDAHGELEEAASELREVQEEYELWKDSLPENLQSSALGEKLEEVCNIDIESLADTVSSAIDEAENLAGEAEGVELPQGFGRD
jgi:DNA repair ATPase RecN